MSLSHEFRSSFKKEESNPKRYFTIQIIFSCLLLVFCSQAKHFDSFIKASVISSLNPAIHLIGAPFGYVSKSFSDVSFFIKNKKTIESILINEENRLISETVHEYKKQQEDTVNLLKKSYYNQKLFNSVTGRVLHFSSFGSLEMVLTLLDDEDFEKVRIGSLVSNNGMLVGKVVDVSKSPITIIRVQLSGNRAFKIPARFLDSMDYMILSGNGEENMNIEYSWSEINIKRLGEFLFTVNAADLNIPELLVGKIIDIERKEVKLSKKPRRLEYVEIVSSKL